MSPKFEPNVEKAKLIMGREPVNPVGACFDSSIMQFLHAEGTPEDARLCHGIGVATMPGQEGETVIHAWIEFNMRGKRVALDTTWGLVQQFEVYRKKAQLNYVREYNQEEAFRLWQKFNMPGPWDPKIRALDRRTKECSPKTTTQS